MAVSDYVSSTLASARRQADRVVSPDARSKAYDDVNAFAVEHPLIAVSSPQNQLYPTPRVLRLTINVCLPQSFLAAQLAFSLVPLLLFSTFALGTLTFALFTAALFSLFWIGVAMLVLGSTLCVTFGIGVFVWAWAVGSYVAGRWAYSLVLAGPTNNAVVVKKDPEHDGGVAVKSEKGEYHVHEAEVENGIGDK